MLLGFAGILLSGEVSAQTAARLDVTPASLTMAPGDTARLRFVAFDSAGNRLADVPVRFFSSNRADLRVSRDGKVTAVKGGAYTVTAAARDGGNARTRVPVSVSEAPVSRVTIAGSSGDDLVVGEAVRHTATVADVTGLIRDDLAVTWESSDPAVATVDRTGLVHALRPGRVTVTAAAGGVSGTWTYRVVENPIRSFSVAVSADSVRTGDVVHVTPRALDGQNRPVDVAVTFAVAGSPDERATADVPPADVDARGRFVAYRPGVYHVHAIGAGHTASHVIRVEPRQVSRTIQMVGQGAIRDAHTSDLWVWEGVDGRDYAVTGTWGASGTAYFWDVTDPASPMRVDSITVDARTVNDVKVSEDGAVCVISREGASNRRNGIVILDCTDPRDVEILSTFDDDLTGGVHNVFVWRDHVYAVNNGRKYDIINIEDPRNPHRVGVFELDSPGHAIHDVWIMDGIAYSSNWTDGTVMVDVGNGVAGGSPSNPVEIGRATAVGGRNHAAFPYRSPTGRTYIFMGDEIFPDGLNTAGGGTPNRAGGYIHIVDVTDPTAPEEVARYAVPEAGSHNLWIEGDTLYAAFYNGGLRVVDISGELKGNLYEQGREVAVYLPYDPQGFVANAPFTWGPQPFKGHIFFSDWNSGLWAVKLERPEVLTP